MPKKKVRKLSDAQFLQLLKVAAGLLQHTNGDLVQALSMAMVKHHALLRLIRDQELVTDLGPGNAILFVPDEGGLALRLERHPRYDTEEIAPTEEAPYPEIDLLGFEVIESGTTHKSQPLLDAGVFSDDWD
ncbi:MAG: hypothetical protein H6737_02110 [Alphaproteobacteria bacterium]|nr:hypothetical protein [Alphaproteobacteria bacterium]